MNKTLNQLAAYGVGFQLKVLNSLLNNKTFLVNINDVLDPESFDNPSHSWIVSEIISYYRKYHTTPSLDYLSVEVKKIENEVLRVTIVDQLREAFKLIYDDQEFVEAEFANFCRNQELKKALFAAVELYEKGDINAIWSLMDAARKAGVEKTIGHEYNIDIESRYRNEDRKPVGTEWEVINNLLAGGLGAGDYGLVFGGPGGGKSWMLIAIGVAAAKLGVNVIHYTLELSESYVGKRYDACLTGINVEHIQESREQVETVIAGLPGKIVIKEYSPGKASINTLESHLRRCEELGTKPGLVIVDYVDLLKSRRNSKDKKEEIDDINTAIKGLAREMQIPIWSASQVNRAGANDDVIEGDKAAGSYGKIMIIDFGMSISRKRQDKVNGTGRIHIMKNRYGMDGMTFLAKINTSNGSIEINGSELDEEDYVPPGGNSQSTNNFATFSSRDRETLSKKFYELQRL